jgi:hypothetical protein
MYNTGMDILKALGNIVTVGFPYLVAGAVGFYFNFAGGFSKEFFAERARKKRHKINVANEVHRLVNEASTGNFTVVPRDAEHTNAVMTDLDGVDEEMGKVITVFVARWYQIANMDTQGLQRIESTKHLMELRKEVEEKRVILIEWSTKVRAG